MRWLLALLVVAGCSHPAGAPSPPAGGRPAAVGVLPVVAVAPGGSVTLDASLGVRPGPQAQGPVRVSAGDDGRAVVSARPDAGGLYVVPVAVGGRAADLAVRVPRETVGGLRLRALGTDARDPSVVRFEVRAVAADGSLSVPSEVDDDDGVVALDQDTVLDDNAVYFDPPSGELVVDLDALGPGRRLLRLAVRDGARVSEWAEVEVQDRRAVGVRD